MWIHSTHRGLIVHFGQLFHAPSQPVLLAAKPTVALPCYRYSSAANFGCRFAANHDRRTRRKTQDQL